MSTPGSVYLLYHFFHPDDVVSGRLFSDLAEELSDAGFDVTALPSIRSCHGAKVRLAQRQSWSGGEIRRVWRPDWPQQTAWGRFGNALCMLLGWTWLALVMPRRRKEVMIVGTDPVLGVLSAISWRILRPRARIIHWCHDVFPHAAVAEGMLRRDSLFVRAINAVLAVAYRRCDVIADLGVCMRRLLQEASGDPVEPLVVIDRAPRRGAAALQGAEEFTTVEPWQPTHGPGYAGESAAATLSPEPESGVTGALRSPEAGMEVVADHGPAWRSGRYATLVPWSLVEPADWSQPDPLVREELFGQCDLGLLYSGNMGRAHSFDSVLALARRLRGDRIGFCFAGRGPRAPLVREAVTAADGNIHFAGFAQESELAPRLAAADIHLVTLRNSWTGMVVPSKFFGALACGRPVLFAGSPDSTIAHWIESFDVGWVLTEENIDDVAQQLRRFSDDPAAQGELRQRCFDTYHQQFSRRVQIDRWLEVVMGATAPRRNVRLPRPERREQYAAHGADAGAL